MAQYTLPDLPYDYAALEPHISGQITELHYAKHHQAYVTGVNNALEQMAEARDKESFGTLPGLEKALAFNLGGHINHSIWWPNLSPDGGDKPDGELAAAIDDTSGRSMRSRSSSPRTRRRSWGPAGRSWPGTAWASG